MIPVLSALTNPKLKNISYWLRKFSCTRHNQSAKDPCYHFVQSGEVSVILHVLSITARHYQKALKFRSSVLTNPKLKNN